MKKISEPLLRHGRWLAAVGAGLVLASAFPKFNLAGFAWVAPALMLAAAHGKSGGERFRLGYVSGLAFWLASLYWLLLMPVTGFPILGWLALAGYVALYQGVWLWLVGPAPRTMGLVNQWIEGEPQQSNNPTIQQSNVSALPDSWPGRLLWALGGAAAWVALEMVRARLFTGFPWSFLGVSQYQLVPLLQIAAFTGVYGVSFLVAWFSLALYAAVVMIFRHPTRRHVWQAEIVLPMFVVAGCYLGDFFAINRGATAESFLRVTAIQPSVPQTLIWNPREDARRFQELLARSQRALTNATDLLVWPESAVPDIDEPTYEAINQFVQSNHIWLILNAEDVVLQPDATNYFNAAFLVGPDGRWRLPAYHKRKLVIFGEYVPLANWLPFLKWFTPISGGWTPGDKPVTFELEQPASVRLDAKEPADLELGAPIRVNCAPLICFEDTFPGAARESAQGDVDFLVNLTNDGWFQESAEQWQHLANAVFRAVENGVPLLRCANNGVTCLIDRHGRIERIFRDARGSEYGPGALTVEIPLRAAEKSTPTFYHRHGDWFGWSCVAATLLWLGRKIRGASKRRDAEV